MEPIKVQSIAHLKQILGDGENHDFFILLTGGLRSRKLISWGGSAFYVLNLVDDEEQELSEAQLMDERYTNVGKAIGRGALYLDD